MSKFIQSGAGGENFQVRYEVKINGEITRRTQIVKASCAGAARDSLSSWLFANNLVYRVAAAHPSKPASKSSL